MRIEELHLQNFRGFRELKLTLPPDLAVFIGSNGSGKSSILDSIAIILSQFVSLFNKTFSKFDLTEDDINIKSDTVYNIIHIVTDTDTITGENTKLTWKNINSSTNDLWKLSQIEIIQNTNDVEINNYAYKILEDIDIFPHLSLPILVYYQTNRISISSASLNDSIKDTQVINQLDGYKEAFSDKINDFRDFLYWFKEEEEYENEVRLRQDTNFRNPRLEIIRKALETFLEGFPNTQFSDLHIVRVSSSREGGIRRLSKPSLVIKKNGENFKLDQLSDGEKTLLMIVVDI
ncbi:MAG: AAA family ATPase, partial [Dolichospermum sp.]